MNINDAMAMACANDYERGKRDAKEFREVQYTSREWIGTRDNGSRGLVEYVSSDYLDGLAAGGCAVLEPIARRVA
jgi:hypothetical protein